MTLAKLKEIYTQHQIIVSSIRKVKDLMQITDPKNEISIVLNFWERQKIAIEKFADKNEVQL